MSGKTARTDFRDSENGYVPPTREQELSIPDNESRRYDKQRGDPRAGPVRAIEDKSGEISSRKDLSQLKRDYELIRDGKVEHLLLRSVEGEKISAIAHRLIKDLQRDFPNKFTHQIITREEAREIWARGLEKETAPQLELPGVGEQARLQKQRQREARSREQATKEKEGQQREQGEESPKRAVEREPADARAREIDHDETKPATVARESTDPTTKAREVRQREEAQTRETIDSLGSFLSDAQKDQILAARRQERDNERDAVALEMKPARGEEPSTPPPPAPQRTPKQEREDALARAGQERENARVAAREAGLSPEIMGILGLNSNDPPKMIDADAARTHAEAERDRAIHQKRERERSERERDARHRSE
ncbi:hypothetical protein ACQPXH_27560 [Nocardia sp. CA-135953]|uniref:hypothetical protein n=1 Tax=Nocardia sp. CA-135953 TaxID=3239978 RepID=UPI003D992360